MNIRQKNWQLAENKEFDVVIIGGGINGATVYNRLCTEGYKVLLVDRGDFSCGTSQASAMMIWGGLLYLKNLDLFSVYHFSRDRDDLIKTHTDEIDPMLFRYIPNCEWGRNRYLVHLALYLYWILGNFRRQKPAFQRTFRELKLLGQKGPEGSFIYQEGFLRDSDSRFVLNWILSRQTEDSFALNYCAMEDAHYSALDKQWTIHLADTIEAGQCSVKAKMILNCAGVWADSVNHRFGIGSPYRHVMSKGVFIGFQRPESHETPIIFEMGEHGDTLTFIPWGPISLWGPTETMEDSIENGFAVNPGDIHFLQHHAAKNLEPSLAAAEIISLRCGIRPLAVKKTFKADCYPLDISRYHKIAQDQNRPWISVYGGKISSCLSMAHELAGKIAPQVVPSLQKNTFQPSPADTDSWVSFPGLQERFPSIEWCVEHEFCCTLEDYLRRRTNISQWIAREGLGSQNENLAHIGILAQHLPAAHGRTPENLVADYVTGVAKRFDQPLAQI
jgi:glycerol-3-phosphate dehydrogenase